MWYLEAHPAIAYFVVLAGLLLICLEFCRPGWVVPGVVGGVMAVLGVRAGARPANAAAIVATIVFLGVAVGLLVIARRARRNKQIRFFFS